MTAHAKHPVRDRDFYDEREARKPTRKKFIPRRRGKAKITWPLAPKKALIYLTGRTPFSRGACRFKAFS
jgi:hypothetical protein